DVHSTGADAKQRRTWSFIQHKAPLLVELADIDQVLSIRAEAQRVVREPIEKIFAFSAIANDQPLVTTLGFKGQVRAILAEADFGDVVVRFAAILLVNHAEF